MLAAVRMDLHVHTLLSPCAEVEMIPELILATARMRGLDLIAITDHNAAGNTQACIEAAEGGPVKVLAGMECETLEGVHVLALFDTADQAMSLQEFIWASLPDLPNRPEYFGQQMLVTAHGEFAGYEERLLAVASGHSLESVVNRIHELKGLAVPAHVDKTYAGLLGVLGFFPEGLAVDGVEVSPQLSCLKAREQFQCLAGRGLIHASDAHRLDEIGQSSCVAWLKSRNVEELKLALGGLQGRRLEDNN